MSNVIIPRGEHPYDLFIGARVRQPPLSTVRQLMHLYPDDFEAAASALAADEWRLLYRIHSFPIYALADPGFDLMCELFPVFDNRQIMDGARHEQIGSARDVDCIAESIRVNVSILGADQQKAIWCIMVGAKQSDMESQQLLHDHWWNHWETM